MPKEPDDPVIHVESFEDLISLLPLPPCYQSPKSEKPASNKVLVDQNQKPPRVSPEPPKKCSKSREKWLLQEISSLKCAASAFKSERGESAQTIKILEAQCQQATKNQKSLEEKNRDILELYKKSQTEIESKDRLISTLKLENKSLPARNELKKNHKNELETLKESHKKKEQKLVEKHRQELESIENKHEEEERKLKSRIYMLQCQATNTETKKSNTSSFPITYEETRWLIENSTFRCLRQMETETMALNRKLVQAMKNEINALREEPKPFVRWFLSGIWNGALDLCSKLYAHFMRQSLQWKLIYIAVIGFIASRIFKEPPPKTVIQNVISKTCDKCLKKLAPRQNRFFR